MNVVHDLLARLRGLVLRRREEAELDEELRFHLDMEADLRRRGGASPAEARRQSAIALGGVERTKEAVRDARGTRWLEDLGADVSFALRTIRRSPGFATIVIAMLATGIGANTAIFTLIDAVVVRALPVAHAEELVTIGDPSLVNSSGRGLMTQALSYPLYRDIRDHGGPLSGVLASGPTGRLDVMVDGPAAELEHPWGRFVSGNYFSVLGVPAWRGRVFGATEDQLAGGSPVAVISYGYWTRRFNRDPSILGTTIVVRNVRLTIIGVTPPSFAGEVVGERADIWLPISMHDVLKPYNPRLDRREEAWLLLLGRLAPGATLAQARADLTPFIVRTIVANAQGRSGPDFLARNPRVHLEPGNRGLSGVRATFATPLLTLMVGVALVLCIICANVANLLLARAVARGREMAVRLALGAERGRLIRLLLTESAILALLGAAAGLLLASWGSRVLLALASDGTAIPLDLSLDVRVLAFTVSASFAAVALFGLAPAVRASRAEYASMLRASARSVTGALGTRGRRSSLGSLIIGGQVALSVVLLVGAAMLTRSLRNVQSVGVGLDRDHLLILDVDINAHGYVGEPLTILAHTIRERLAATPGVTAVAFSENGIFSGTDWHTEIAIPGFAPRARDDSVIATDNVGPGYVRGIGGRLLAGRDIAPTDEGHPVRVAVVNQSFANFYFRGENAVGKSFLIEDSIAIAIVGVMADTRDHDLEKRPDRRAYFPYVPTDTVVSNPTSLRFAVRTSGDPRGMVEQVRKIVVEIDPLLPIDGIDPLPALMRQSIREERLVAYLATAFGLLALLLASLGLYGIMTYAVKRRTAEIGLRSALGAQRNDVLRLVLSDALGVVLGGMVVGVPLALASARLLGAQLHGVGSVDPISIGLALLVLVVSALAAALLPALSASRVSPLVALRAD
jgi:predicted permease